jgi:hypothetical protein
VVAREGLACRGVGGAARHHVPGNTARGPSAEPSELLRLEGEEGALGYGADREFALRRVVAEPGRLAAGHHHDADAPRREPRLAELAGGAEALGAAARLGRDLDRRRLHVRAGLRVRRASHRIAAQQGGQVEARRLAHETPPRVGIEHVPETEDVALAVGGELGTKRLGAVRIGGFGHLAPLGRRRAPM